MALGSGSGIYPIEKWETGASARGLKLRRQGFSDSAATEKSSQF